MSLLSKLHDIDPTQFEIITGLLFVKMGYRISHTGKGPDGGVDLFVYKGIELEAIIQCKRFRTNVSEPVIRDLFGVMNHFGANKGFVVTTADFTSSAEEWSRGKNIELINGNRLVSLLTHFGLDTVIYRKNLFKHEPGDYWSKRSDTVYSYQINDSTRYDLVPFDGDIELSQNISSQEEVSAENNLALKRYRRQRTIESRRNTPPSPNTKVDSSPSSTALGRDDTVFERRVVFPARIGEYSNEPEYHVQNDTQNKPLKKSDDRRITSVVLYLFILGLLGAYTHSRFIQKENQNSNAISKSRLVYLNENNIEYQNHNLQRTLIKNSNNVQKNLVAFVLSKSCKMYKSDELEADSFFVLLLKMILSE